LFGLAGFLVALIAVVLLVLGPAGPWLVGLIAENRQVWRLGQIDLDGVGGAGLGALQVDRVRLTDARGVWLEARDVTLGWAPLKLLGGDLEIETAAAEQVIVFRRPQLSAPEPPGGGGSIDVDLEALRIVRLQIEEPVAGEAGTFSIEGALALAEGAVRTGRLEALRLDAAADRLRVVYDSEAATKLDARLDGAAEGFFAEALGVDAPVTVVATAEGGESGAGRLSASIGAAQAATAALDWTETTWSARAEADLGAAPSFADLARMFGSQANAVASGGRPKGDAAPFNAQLDSENLELVAEGFLGANYQPRGEVQIDASVARVERVTDAVSGGAARFQGVVLLANGVTRAQGRLQATRAAAAGVTASFAGPVDIRITDRAIAIEADVAIGEAVAPEVVADLARGGDLTLRATYERAEARLAIEALDLESPVAVITGQGVFSNGDTALSGRWRVTRLAALDPQIAGAASGPWSVSRTVDGAPLTIIASGAASRFSTTLPALGDLLGPAPDIATRITTTEGGVRVERLVADGRQLRVGATGRIVDERLALALEASARGPIAVGPVQFEGLADATGTVSGPLDALAIEARAEMAAVDIGTLQIERPVLEVSLLPTDGVRAGRASLRGQIAGELATADARLVADQEVFALEDLSVRGAGLEATGRAAFADAGPTVDLAIAGDVAQIAPFTGALQSVVSIRPGLGDAPLTVDAEGLLTNGRLGDVRFQSIGFDVIGPLNALQIAAGLRGRGSGLDIALDADGRASITDDAVTADASLSGAVNGWAITTAAPLTLRIADGATAASGALGIGEGSAQAAFTLGDTLQASARLDRTPLAPILAFLGERASGTATGAVSLVGGGATLRGEADLVLDDALLARRMREPLDVRLIATLDDTILAAEARATSASGLDAAIEGRAPVDASAAPLRIALDGEGQAQWSARGPASALWGLVGTLDQRVTGDIDGAGAVRFSVGSLSGDGYFNLANGGFSDRVSGVSLRDIQARVTFVDDGARLESFSARDGDGGTLTGEGVAAGVGEGRITLVANSIRLLNRQDAQATASGPIELVWRPDGAALTGDLRIQRAELEPPAGAAAAIPQLDVIEINVPPRLAARRAETAPEAQAEDESAPAYPVTLAVRVRAPGLVFLRGRGLDTEWSVDLTAAGTVSAPTLVGEARLVRGSFDLASRRFDIDEGVVRFDGSPENAQIDVVAVRDTPDLTARVAVTGTVTEPELQFSSTPALPEDEILPQILFGRSVEDLSALEAAQLAGGLAQLAGRSAFDLAGAARTLVGLDRLDVRDTDEGVRVAGGKYLTRNVYLEVARTGRGETETAIEWRVRPRFYVISAFAPEGDRRLSVRWRREY
jgi:translocation and assembly module TamB